ncbi:MAG: DUF2092 domain-containing protein [Victivallales bacterium]|nr:DUF2092 domain-containing protein [Victivallales bacterium]
MTSLPFGRIAVVALVWVAGASRAQEARPDAKSKELIDKADAVLRKAEAISLVQRQRVILSQEGVELYNMRGAEVSIQAARPTRFRVEQKGETAEYTVSTGPAWIRYVKEAGAYQKTDVSKYDASLLYRCPQPLRLLQSRRGLVSLWLGKHSLRGLLPAGNVRYDGVKRLHGTPSHRLSAKARGITYLLYLSTEEPTLPLFLVASGRSRERAAPSRIRLELAFADWDLAWEAPRGVFEFGAPDGAREVADLTGMGGDTAADRFALWLVEGAKTELRRVRPAPAGKPFPSGDGVVTDTMHLDRLRTLYRASMKRQYEAHGHHDPKWDAAVFELQDMWARRLMGDQSFGLLMALREKAYYIQSLGCHDPLLLYRVANFTHYLEGSVASGPLWAPAWEALRDSSYPASAKLAALRRHIKSVGGARGQAKAQLPQLYERQAALFAAATAEPEFGSGAQRLARLLLNTDWNGMSFSQEKRVIGEMEKTPNVDPWLRAYYTGRYHITAGWEERGTSMAGGVTKQGWKGFAGHLAIAKKELMAAWKLHPEFPEAPTEMITIAMAGHADESVRFWFDRAVAAQIDWGDAYAKLRWAYQSRWGGEADWVYQHGLEAARTKRFDSYAPHQYWLSLREIRTRIGSWPRVMDLPGALDALKMVCDGYAERDSEKYPARFWETIRLFGCWAGEDYAAGAESLRRLNGRIDYKAFDNIYVDPNQVIRETSLLGGTRGADVAKGLQLLAEGEDAAAAVPILRQAMLALRDAAPEDSVYLGDRICRVRFADAPDAADLILDTMVDMRRREAVVQSFAHWMREGETDVPDAFQGRVAAYLGPIGWAFMQEAPVDRAITNDEIAARIARVAAMEPGKIPGIEELALPERESQFQTEKALALLRLHYCWKPTKGNTWKSAWSYNKKRVAPLVKTFPRHGVLIDFLSEHHDRSKYRYEYDMTKAFKTMTHVQEIDNWEQYSAYRFFPEVERLAEIADPEARVTAAWQLYWLRGSPRIGFMIKHVLDQAGDSLEAALMERHLLSYLYGFSGGPGRSNDQTHALVLELNSVPGYEDQVIDHAKKLGKPFRYREQIHLCRADACIRLGDLEGAVEALVESKADLSRMSQWTYVAGGRHHGASESIDALIVAISRHPQATPETLTMLQLLFPERLAAAQAR